ncbi:hypothetical protein [Brevibacillus sp. NRS-1366]|uniref:hypothetical protein n=1 Tax=Brevibacillus sp. NRS-1366 TaxID=3233899 RepID=UPI003D19B403
MVKDKMQNHVQKDVYDVYKPKIYERTGELKKDIVIRELVDGVVIVPTRTDEETGRYIPEVIESGNGYSYNYGYGYEQPRPFVENTRKELRDTGAHVEKLKQGLKARGLDVK